MIIFDLVFYILIFVTPEVKTRRLSLPRYWARSWNRREGRKYRIFFNSAVTYEFAIICKVVIRFLCRLLHLIQNIALYCLAKLQHNQVMDAVEFDDMNIPKCFIRFSHSILMKESTSITSIRKKIFSFCKKFFEAN